MNNSTHTDEIESRQTPVYAVLILAAIALVMFGDLAFRSGGTVVSHQLGDGSQYFSRMRDFGFSELAKGNIPLWNPHIFSGTPFVGAFQSGMFYPPNLMYMVLPLARAMNLDTVLHVFLMSFFMFAWAKKQGLSTTASVLSGVLLAYGGASFIRVMAGHITMLQAFSWAPLILLSIDHVFEKRSNGWMLIGVGATAMQMLVGHPPSVIMTAMAAFFYCCTKLIGTKDRTGILIRLVPFAVFPPSIACVQWWTGLDTATESIRAAGVTYEFATSYSYPPENLLTLLMPALFGNVVNVMYWGRWAFWDSTAFMGIGGLVLVASSVYFGSKSLRRYSATLLLFFSVLSLGSYTPIYGFFFDHIPGFDSFRSPAKFMFPASLFMAMLAGLGTDAIIQGKVNTKKIPIAIGFMGGICLLGAIWLGATSIGSEPSDTLREFVDQRADMDETFFVSLAGHPLPDDYYVQVVRLAFVSFLVAGCTCAILCTLLLSSSKKSWVLYAIPVMTILEVLVFARLHRPTFELTNNDRPGFDQFYVEDPGDYRIMDVSGIDNATRNHAVDARKSAIWGYDPIILDRYAQFVIFAEGKRSFDTKLLEAALTGADPMTVSVHELQNYEFLPSGKIEGDLALYPLLRCKYMIINAGKLNDPPSLWFVGESFPRFFFSNTYSVHDTKDAIFSEMSRQDENGEYLFDPTEKILLESNPVPRPALLAPTEKLTSSFEVLSQTTDSVELRIDVNHNTILVVTDSYSKNWIAKTEDQSVQQAYEVIPVDYTLRGIPLAAGTHHIMMEYAPDSYVIGKWISLVSVIAYVLCCGLVFYRHRVDLSIAKQGL